MSEEKFKEGDEVYFADRFWSYFSKPGKGMIVCVYTIGDSPNIYYKIIRDDNGDIWDSGNGEVFHTRRDALVYGLSLTMAEITKQKQHMKKIKQELKKIKND